MTDRHPEESRKFFFFPLLAAALLLLAGNAPAFQSHTPDTTPTFPNYRPGTTYVYADGTWETVMETTPGRVSWKNHRGDRYSGSPDFTFRPSSWQGRNREARRTFSERADLLLKRPGSLWPLKKGNKAEYTETGLWQDKSGNARQYTAQWSCEVIGREEVSVPAGNFDAWEVQCRRYSVSSGLRSTLRQVDTWFYSPDLGHYVLKESRSTSGKTAARKELLAVVTVLDRIPPAAGQAMEKSFQTALEKKTRGVPVSWQYAPGRLSGETVAAETFQSANGVYCRRYVQTVRQAQQQERYFGMACRNAEGTWYIPRR